KGIEYFLSHQVPDYKRFTPPLVASITSQTADDFEAMTRDVNIPEADVIEVNISCPTRHPGGGNFALHEDHTLNIRTRIRKATGCGGIVKVADVVEYVLAGASAVLMGYIIFRNPSSMIAILEGLEEWCRKRGFPRVADLTGAMIDDPPAETFAAAAAPIG